MEAVEVSGLRIAFEQQGQGPPLVLLHGFVGDGISTWGHQLEALSDEFTVIAWDAPGAGRSAAAPDSFRVPEFADCLAGFIAALGLTEAYVGGLSFGSMVALELYRRHRDLPRKLILASGYAGWAGSFSPDVVKERLRRSLEVSVLPADDFVAAMLPGMFSPGASPSRVASFAASVGEFHPEGFQVMARASAEADLRDSLAAVAVPTLLVYGDQDVRAPLSVADALQAAIPGSRLVVLPGVGHVCSVEAPDQFTAEVRAFLHELW